MTRSCPALARLVPLAVAVLAAAPVPAAGQPGDTVPVRLTEADCRAVVVHEPAPDVAFTPGVDVRGRPVAPADLPGTVRIEVPDEVVIPITIDLARRLGIPHALFEADAYVGTVTVVDGRPYFDGQPLFDADQAALAAACRQAFP